AGDPLGKFLGSQKAARRSRPRIRLPVAPHEQGRKLTSPSTRIRLAVQHSLQVEQEPGEAMAKFFAAGTWWFIQPEFIAAFQRLSGHESVPFQELAAMLPNRQLVAMLAAAIDTMANAGLVFKEETSGYRVDNRKLLIDPDEAVTVRMIFERYLELGSIRTLVTDLNNKGVRTRVRQTSN